MAAAGSRMEFAMDKKKLSQDDLRKSLALYAVTDRQWLKEGETLADKVAQAIEGGATFIQLREKSMDRDAFEKEALKIKEVCASYHVPFVLDDDVELAVKIDCDGVHVGQEDMEAGRVRELIGPDKILGVSAKTVDQALLAQSRGADYLGVGAVFSTSTKPGAIGCDLKTIGEITKAVDIPCIAIGGVNESNIDQLTGVAVVSAIFAQDDVKKAAASLLERTRKALDLS